MAGKAKLLLAFLILGQLCFSLWTQNLTVSVHDQNGVPVENADVRITYQKLSAISFGDGLSAGKTSANGTFFASLSNSVQPDLSEDYFIVNASTPYWKGKSQTVQVDVSREIAVNFTLPMALGQVLVNVTGSDGLPIQNASVYLLETASKKATDEYGLASFYLPESSSYLVLVNYNGESARFASANARLMNKTRQSDVLISISSSHSLSTGELLLRVQFFGLDGAPLADYPVSYGYQNASSGNTTDSKGYLYIRLNQSGQVNLSIINYNHEYRYLFDAVVKNNTRQQRNESVTLKPLLSINSFTSGEDGLNCFVLTAKITDPRVNFPLEVSMVKSIASPDLNMSLNIPLPVGLTDDGLYTSRLCIKSRTSVKVIASNKFESAQKEINLSVSTPKPPAPYVPSSTTVAPVESGFVDVALSIAAFLIVIAFLVAFIMGRRYVAMITRFIIEYLRLFARILQRRKR